MWFSERTEMSFILYFAILPVFWLAVIVICDMVASSFARQDATPSRFAVSSDLRFLE